MLFYGVEKFATKTAKETQRSTLEWVIDKIHDATKKVDTWFNGHISLNLEIKQQFKVPEHLGVKLREEEPGDVI
jgi:hypothetical protein